MAKPFGTPVAKCPKCELPIGEQHPYAWCSECGEPLPPEILYLLPGQSQKSAQDQPLIDPLPAPSVASASFKGSAELCIILGLGGIAVGGYFLLNPSDSSIENLGRNIINLQRIALGQTLAIVGAIFLAVGIRPR
jgi:hypothetical protein